MVTVVVLGYAHGGTTMVAGILEILGVPMVGEKYSRHNWEDTEVKEALQDEAQFAALVAERNRQHDNWGFKMPGAWQHADLLKKYLRNPVYLAIFKDPVSVTRRRFGGVVSGNRVRSTVKQMLYSIEGIYDSRLQPHILAYLDAMVEPRRFVTDIVKLVGIPPDYGDIERAVKFIQPNTTGDPLRKYPRVNHA